MIDEIKVVIQNKTWELIELLSDKKAIPLKWVFKVKWDAKDVFEKYKARIIIKRFSQIAGLDFNKTFTPIVRIESIRIILILAATNDLHILHIDCKNIFLYNKNDIELYISQPEGFFDREFPGKTLYLNKSLYKLKQTSHLGFVQLETNSCIYIQHDIIMKIYVDDINIIDLIILKCETIYKELTQHMKIESKGSIKNFLNIDIIHNWNQHLITLNQGAYIDHLISEFELINAHTIPTSLNKTLSLLKTIPDKKMYNSEYYQHLTRSLNHFTIFTRPDIIFIASKLAQFNSNPTTIYLITILHMLRYLKDTRNLSIIYKRQEHKLIILGHSNSDWTIDSNDRKSFTGYVFMIHDESATWISHKQTMITHSSTDSKYMTISNISRKIIARIQFFQELNIPSTSILILINNNIILNIVKNDAINHCKAKYIDIKYHIIHHYIQEEKVMIDHISSSENITDLFTKALRSQKHQ